MKKYACNRLYIDDLYFSQAIITVNGQGLVESYSPLSEETAATEWIGGAVFLSDKKDKVLCTDFQSFRKQMAGAKQILYAWHISNFDFHREEFTSQSVVRRL